MEGKEKGGNRSFHLSSTWRAGRTGNSDTFIGAEAIKKFTALGRERQQTLALCLEMKRSRFTGQWIKSKRYAE